MRVCGDDPNGIPRVWANDDYEQTAFAFARKEAQAYVRRRPDTGPLDRWHFYEVLGGSIHRTQGDPALAR